MASDEDYLYLYEYAVEGEQEHCKWFGYFRNRQEVEIYITFYSAPHIKPISIKECTNGLHLGNVYIPHKKSDWNKAHPDNPEK
jgi:hypothetical protein